MSNFLRRSDDDARPIILVGGYSTFMTPNEISQWSNFIVGEETFQNYIYNIMKFEVSKIFGGEDLELILDKIHKLETELFKIAEKWCLDNGIF